MLARAYWNIHAFTYTLNSKVLTTTTICGNSVAFCHECFSFFFVFIFLIVAARNVQLVLHRRAPAAAHQRIAMYCCSKSKLQSNNRGDFARILPCTAYLNVCTQLFNKFIYRRIYISFSLSLSLSRSLFRSLLPGFLPSFILKLQEALSFSYLRIVHLPLALELWIPADVGRGFFKRILKWHLWLPLETRDNQMFTQIVINLSQGTKS